MESNLLSVRSWNAGVGGLEKFSRGAGQERRRIEDDLFFLRERKGEACSVPDGVQKWQWYVLPLILFPLCFSALIPCLTLSVPGCFAFFYMSHSTAECRAADGLTDSGATIILSSCVLSMLEREEETFLVGFVMSLILSIRALSSFFSV
ncbi:hypothetical protein GGI43DRAFT_402443, partial [Trichoderma evansii]